MDLNLNPRSFFKIFVLSFFSFYILLIPGLYASEADYNILIKDFEENKIDCMSFLDKYIELLKDDTKGLISMELPDIMEIAHEKLTSIEYALFIEKIVKTAQNDQLPDYIRNALANAGDMGWTLQVENNEPLKDLPLPFNTGNRDNKLYLSVNPDFNLNKIKGNFVIATTSIGNITINNICDYVISHGLIDDITDNSKINVRYISGSCAFNQIIQDEMFKKDLFNSSRWKTYWDYEETNFLYNKGLDLLEKDEEYAGNFDAISKLYPANISSSDIG